MAFDLMINFMLQDYLLNLYLFNR